MHFRKAVTTLALLLPSLAMAVPDKDSDKESEKGWTFVPISVCDGCSTLPYGINDWGQVTGSFFDPSGTTRGFLKTGNKYTIITIPGAIFVEAQRPSNTGRVVGDYQDENGIGRPFVRETDGTLDLKPGCPGATFSGAILLFHHDSAILGYCTSDPAQITGYRGFVARGTHYETFSYPGPDVVNTFPVSINLKGEMVGSFEVGAVQNEHGFYRSTEGEWRQIDYPGSVQCEVFDISDTGDMLGRYEDAHGINHGFFLRKGVFTRFDYVGPSTYIWKMNRWGAVVGYSFTTNAYGPPTQAFEAHRAWPWFDVVEGNQH